MQTTLYFLEAQIEAIQVFIIILNSRWSCKLEKSVKMFKQPMLGLTNLGVNSPTIFRLSSRQLSIVTIFILLIFFVVNSHN